MKNKELVLKCKKEMTLRKKLHNELADLKGNIRVYCRVRPVVKEVGGGKTAKNVISLTTRTMESYTYSQKEQTTV